jgi:hypothetical protein
MAGSPKKRARNEALGLGKLSDFKITPPGIEPPTREAWNGAAREIGDKREISLLNEAKANIGRPSVFSKEKAESLIELVAGGLPLSRACKLVGINRKTINNWIYGETGNGDFLTFRESLARAREDGGEALAGEALRVARETYEKEEVTSAQVQSATLYTNVLKWYAGTLNTAFNPNAIKHLEITGANGAPLNAPVVIDARSLPDDQREAVRQALLAMRGDSAKTIDG